MKILTEVKIHLNFAFCILHFALLSAAREPIKNCLIKFYERKYYYE